MPLSRDAKALIDGLRHHNGPYIFTSTDGEKAVNGWSNAKEEIDRAMARELGHEPQHWVLHDLRHVIRSRMAALRVPDNVAEMCLGHAKRGLQRVYDEHSYEPR